ncbi:MAG: peptidase S41, partial [Chloroflexi bacterium]
MYRKTYVFLLMTVLAVMALGAVSLVGALDDAPEAPITNDEGGPVSITGSVSYTNSFFTAGVAEPVIILEDQAGFIDRNKGFLMPVESQVLGQITSDFFTSPFTYSLTLPIEPRGTLRDVDHDDVEETGVMVFAVAYWTNIFGDPYLEERDLFGGGWSTAYASTHVKQNPTGGGEYIGGKVLIYAPEEGQGFPSGFGEDGLLFTEDDPIVIVPQGYTLVDMDTDPFTFDRSRHPVVDLIEGEGAEADDFSDLSYTEAFDALVDLMSKEYAFTEFKGIDWDALREEFRPMFEEAEANNSNDDYKRALMRFTWAIPDGHVGTSAFV